jgi:hypothetical protein
MTDSSKDAVACSRERLTADPHGGSRDGGAAVLVAPLRRSAQPVLAGAKVISKMEPDARDLMRLAARLLS